MQAEIARRAGLVRDELDRLSEDLWAEDSARISERLAAIAQQVAGTAAALAGREEQRPARRGLRDARPAGAAAEAAGLAALRDLLGAPSRIGEVAGWLQPQHFARREHGEVFAVLTDLNRAGMPVDPVTVSWEAGRRSIQIQPEDVAGGCGAFATRQRGPGVPAGRARPSRARRGGHPGCGCGPGRAGRRGHRGHRCAACQAPGILSVIANCGPRRVV